MMADRLDACRQVEEVYILIIFYFAHDYTRARITILAGMHHFEPVALAVVADTEIIARLAIRRPLIITEGRVAVFFLRLTPEIRLLALRREEFERQIRPLIHLVMIGIIGLDELDLPLVIIGIAIMRPEAEDTTAILKERMGIFDILRQAAACVKTPGGLAVVIVIVLHHLLHRSAQAKPCQVVLRHRITGNSQLRPCRNKEQRG